MYNKKTNIYNIYKTSLSSSCIPPIVIRTTSQIHPLAHTVGASCFPLENSCTVTAPTQIPYKRPGRMSESLPWPSQAPRIAFK